MCCSKSKEMYIVSTELPHYHERKSLLTKAILKTFKSAHLDLRNFFFFILAAFLYLAPKRDL